MEDFVAYTSRWRTALLFAGCIALFAIGIWMAGVIGPIPVSRRSGPLMTQIWGWITIVFFGTCAFIIAKIWLENKEQLRISPSGIKWSRWSDQTIPWHEINDVTEWRYIGTKFIILHICNPSLFSGRGITGFVGKTNRALTGGDIGITLTGTDRKFDEAMAAIAYFRSER